MYRCESCGKVFNEPNEYYGERLEYWGAPCRKTWTGCPNCLGDYIEIIICEICGKNIAEEESGFYEHICDKCAFDEEGKY